jgi:hypothetical protein
MHRNKKMDRLAAIARDIGPSLLPAAFYRCSLVGN